MPRVMNNDRDIFDFCQKCYVKSAGDRQFKSNDTEWDTDHPPYENTESYRCDYCHKLLTRDDN